MENLKEHLDDLVKKYETEEFISHDPIQFIHRFSKKQDAEISGLVASSLAYGNRKHIIAIVNKIHELMEYEPYEFCKKYTVEKGEKIFEGVNYRYTSSQDLVAFFHCLSESLKKYDCFEDMFVKYYQKDDKNIKNALIGFSGEIKSFCPQMRGLNFLLPSPVNNSACKRLNLFLKWMVRKPPVDLGLWTSVDPAKLIIPLDTHVARISQVLGICSRKSNDWQKAEMITDILKECDPSDPAKYDFALFGFGVENRNVK